MTTSKFKVEKVIAVRALSDFAPKVVAAGIGGLSASELISFASMAHVSIPTNVATLIVTLVSVVCGWIKADTSILSDLHHLDASLASTPEAAQVTNVANIVRSELPVALHAADIAAPAQAHVFKNVSDGVGAITDALGAPSPQTVAGQ